MTKTTLIVTILATVITILNGFNDRCFASSVSERPDKPFLSSIPYLFLKPTQKFDPTTASLTLYPERFDQIPISLSKKNRMIYTYSLQKDRHAPIVFLIPGMGGFAFNGPTLYVAELAYQQGYSVVTLPSTTHWSFALAASKTGRTGYLPDDARDMYRVITQISFELKQKFKVAPKKWGLIGMSYGGLDGAFVFEKDLEKHVFDFDFLLMISPPLNRWAALEKADQYFAYGEPWSMAHRTSLHTFILGRTMDIASGILKIDNYSRLEKAFPLKESTLAWLMAVEFRRTALDTAHIGNIIERKGSQSMDDAFTGSISNYMRDIVYNNKLKNSTQSLNQIEQESDLKRLLQIQSKSLLNKKMVLFHSTNDFLSFPQSENILEQSISINHIYNYGGHMGFIGDPRWVEDFKLSLLKLKN